MATRYTISGTPSEGINLTGSVNGKEIISISANRAEEFETLDIALEALKMSLLNKNAASEITIDHDYITQRKIPALVFQTKTSEKQPLAIITHGLNSSKLSAVQSGISLAEEGFTVIVIDALYHGERKADDPLLLSIPHDQKFIQNFIEVLNCTSKDISELINYYENSEFVDSSRVGVMGTSMGGFGAFHALVNDTRIKAIAPLVATPDWSMFFDHPQAPSVPQEQVDSVVSQCPLSHYKKMVHAAILIQNNKEDHVVSAAGSRKLASLLEPFYISTPDRFSYIEYEQSGHNVSWEMYRRVINWFREYV